MEQSTPTNKEAAVKSRFKRVCVFGSSTRKMNCYRDATIELSSSDFLGFFEDGEEIGSRLWRREQWADGCGLESCSSRRMQCSWVWKKHEINQIKIFVDKVFVFMPKRGVQCSFSCCIIILRTLMSKEVGLLNVDG
ncbi:hypothetical protein LINPERHAP1_LOCUS18246 [Linum perenne]